MINKELINSYVNQLSIEQLRKVMFEIIHHYELNDEYNLDRFIDGIVNVTTNSAKTVDRADYLLILKENTDLFGYEKSKIIQDSIKIIGYDNIFNSVRIEYVLEGNDYHYRVNVNIDEIKEREKLNNLK